MNAAKNSSAAVRITEKRFGAPLRQVFLSGRYSGWTKEAICSDLGVSVRTLDNWMARCGVGFRRVIVDVHDSETGTKDQAETKNGKAAA